MKPYAIAIVAFVLICISFAAFLQLSIDWQTWRIATCMPDDCFCEEIRTDTTIAQPANTWSSLVFALTGLLIVAHAFSLTSDYTLSTLFGGMLAIALILIGVGSAFYHATMTFWGQFIDVGSMYLLASFMLVYAWMRLYNITISLSATLYITMNIILFGLLYYAPETRRILFAVMLVLGIGFELYYATTNKPDIDRIWFTAGLFLFGVAYAIWIIDTNRILCDADSLLQGHAIWHILGAVSSGMLYLYYASETSTQ